MRCRKVPWSVEPGPGHRRPGLVRRAGASRVWRGGIAFHHPDGPGELAARADLVSVGQFSDVVAQEARRPVGSDLALDQDGRRRWPTPSGIYESVLHVGDLDGLPLLMITSLQPLTPTAPSTPYLRAIMGGLRETFGWGVDERVGYLLRAPGVSPAWTAEQLAELSPS